MRKIVPFNRFEVLSTDLTQLQAVSQEELRDRLTDNTVNTGIVIPASAVKPVDIQNIIYNASASVPFAFVFTGSLLDVESGIAIDSDGERIEIDDSVACTGNLSDPLQDPPRFKTYEVSGDGSGNYLTPFSTGSKTISDPDPTETGAVNPHTINGILCVERFVFISYVSVVETVANPSNHENNNGSVVPADNYRKPLTALDQKQGTAYAHRRKNGYRIYVAKEAELSGTSPYPTLATAFPSPEDNTKALFVGSYYLRTDTHIIYQTNTARQRPVFRSVPIEVAKIDASNATSVYADQQTVGIIEHVNAIEDPTKVSPSNPHGTTTLSTGTDSDVVTNGLIDDSSAYGGRVHPSNSPIETTTILLPTINNSFGTNNTAGSYYKGTAPQQQILTSINVGVTISAVQFNIPISSDKQSAFINGHHVLLETLTPFIAGSPATGFVPFSSSAPDVDGIGLWCVYVAQDLVNTTNAILGKHFLGTDNSYDLSVLPTNAIPICIVYWNGSNAITQTRLGPTGSPTPADVRSIGTVSIKQISTNAMSHPEQGLFSRQAFGINKLADGDFTYNKVPSTNAQTFWQSGSGTNGTISLANAVDATALETERCLSVSIQPGGGLFNQSVRTKVSGGGGLTGTMPLKPSTKYVLSGLIWATSSAHMNHNVLAQLILVNTSNVEGAIASTDSKPIIFARDGAWHRFSVTLITKDYPTVRLSLLSQLKLTITREIVDAGDNTPTTLKLANLMLTEGEWTNGFVPGAKNVWAVTSSPQNIMNATGATWGNYTAATTFYSYGQMIRIFGWATYAINSPLTGQQAKWRLYIDGGIYLSSESIGHLIPASSGTGDTTSIMLWETWLSRGSHTVLLQVYTPNTSLLVMNYGLEISAI